MTVSSLIETAQCCWQCLQFFGDTPSTLASRPLAADADRVRLARGNARARAGRRDVRASSIFPGRQSDSLGEDFFRLCPLSSRCRDVPHNLRIPVGRHRAVARESSQYAFVTEVLAPNLEFLRRKLELIRDLDQRVAETVRVGPRKAPRSKGVLKDLANVVAFDQCRRARPKRPVKPMPTSVAGKSGSPPPQSFLCVRKSIRSATIALMSSPTGKK
jgi:hypothetical protein